MPPSARGPASGLTPEQLTNLARTVASGKRPTVYLRDATPSLELPAGASARVVRVDGNTVTLRPRGIDDELPFEAEELRMTRSEPVAPAAPRVRKTAAPRAVDPRPQQAAADRSPTATRTPKRVQDGVSVTIEAGADGEWTVAVSYGGKPRGRPVPVSAEVVGAAVAELGDPAARQAVDDVLVAARKSAAKKVAELSKQLDDARNALAALGSRQS